jgi:hypothetical protein
LRRLRLGGEAFRVEAAVGGAATEVAAAQPKVTSAAMDIG